MIGQPARCLRCGVAVHVHARHCSRCFQQLKKKNRRRGRKRDQELLDIGEVRWRASVHAIPRGSLAAQLLGRRVIPPVRF